MKQGTVLIVDDCYDLASVYQDLFKHHGWGALTASGVREAIGLLPQADIVLSDYNLLDGTGLDVVERAAGNPPVVIFTAAVDPPSYKHVLSKLTNPAFVVNTVQQVLNEHRAAHSLPSVLS